jgi:hypothetical protein
LTLRFSDKWPYRLEQFSEGMVTREEKPRTRLCCKDVIVQADESKYR